MVILINLVRSATAIAGAAILHKSPLMYLDPGSGSFIIQLLIGASAGILVTVGVFWDRIKGFFGRASSKETDEDDEEENEI